jgi:hypothetical protein
MATLLPSGIPQSSALVRDISASGMGLFSALPLSAGTRVAVQIHDHEAHGAVRSCQPEGGGYYLDILFDPAEACETPMA